MGQNIYLSNYEIEEALKLYFSKISIKKTKGICKYRIFKW